MSSPTTVISRRAVAAVFYLSALALAWGLRAARHRPPGFAPPRSLPPAQSAPWHKAVLLDSPTPSAHSAALAELSDGQLAAVWFGGSREGAPDVALYFARYSRGEWEPPRPIMTRADTQAQTRRLVRKLGNPALWADSRGGLHLFYVSVSLGGWSGSAINHAVSRDGGAHWQPARRLITSPFCNLSTLVRCAPVQLAGDELGLPVYHEFIGKFPEWLRLTADGEVLDKTRLDYGRTTLQPAVAALGATEAIALLRYAGHGTPRIQMIRTADAGQSWTKPRPLEAPNPNSSVALIRLGSGRLLMACNPLESGRRQLALLISGDGGQTWGPAQMIEQGADRIEEYSYPALLQDRAGLIHLLYTYQRRAIKHAAFNEAWLTNGPVQALAARGTAVASDSVGGPGRRP